jgi:multicomponent Na+:H+ antiporter subunit B
LSNELPLIYNQTIQYYISYTRDFLKFPNIVTAIIVSFRGYDTLIETIVILTAGIAVLSILSQNSDTEQKELEKPATKSILYDKSVITNMVMMIIPFIVLFAFYIQAHGEESPGGGFQSGSILACAIIGYSLAISESTISKYLKNILLLRIGAFGTLIYFTVGFIPIIKHQNFLNHSYLLCSPDTINLLCFAKSQKIGIFLAELGVGITVFAVVTMIFFNLKPGTQNV